WRPCRRTAWANAARSSLCATARGTTASVPRAADGSCVRAARPEDWPRARFALACGTRPRLVNRGGTWRSTSLRGAREGLRVWSGNPQTSFHLDVGRLHDGGPLCTLRGEHLVEILRGA